MPVEDDDLEAAAAAYAAQLPERFDLIHLGLGPDGHTASLVPDDPVLDVTDRAVALTAEYDGRRRMTLTYPTINAARQVLFLVDGDAKREPLARLRAGDAGIPAGRVAAARMVLVADATALGED
jgi:6-phosphogluconolactonase/glucosamine-6-phosphate isomerase/deaminase